MIWVCFGKPYVNTYACRLAVDLGNTMGDKALLIAERYSKLSDTKAN